MQDMVYKALLSCIRAVLEGREESFSLPPETDRAALVSLAERHYLIGFLYRVYRYDSLMTREVRDRILVSYFAALAQHTEQALFAEEVFAYMRERKMRYMPLKGWVLRAYYPAPELRMSCDLDVFTEDKHRAEVREWILSRGFAEGEGDVHNDAYRRDSVNFELHHSLSEVDGRERAYYADAWERCVTEDGVLCAFTPEDFYIYMLSHMRKHLYEGNIGVRAVLDIYIWREGHPEMDEGYLKTEEEKLSLAPFASAMEKLSRVWFGEETEDEDMKILGDYILEGGVRATAEQHALMSATTAHGGGRGRYLLRLVFPPYDYMARYFTVLRKMPCLLPAMWVARWVRILFRRLCGKECQNTIGTAASLDRDAVARVVSVRRIAEGKGGKR